MSATTARRRLAAAPTYEVISVTQHWRIVAGAFYRDCVVEYADGRRALLGIRDDLVTVAA